MVADEPVYVSYGITVPGGTPVDGQFEIPRAEWVRLNELQREELCWTRYYAELRKVPGGIEGAWFLENADLDDPVEG